MQVRNHGGSRPTARRPALLPTLLAAVLLAGACGGDSPSEPTLPTPSPEQTPLGATRLAIVPLVAPPAPCGGMLFFTPSDAPGLWRTDGTEAGTVRFDLFDTDVGQVATPPHLTALDHQLFFSLLSPVYGAELGRTDCTTAETEVLDLIPDFGVLYITRVGGQVFLVLGATMGGRTLLWASDGTPGGTAELAELIFGAPPAPIVDLGGRAFFRADDGTTGSELWTSDGTASGTLLVDDLYPGGEGSFPSTLTPGSTRLYFGASDGVHDWSLWRTDARTGAIRRVYDLGHLLLGAATVGDVVYFLPDWQLTPRGLWRSDGTAEGTYRLCSIRDHGTEVVAVGTTVFFAGDDGIHGRELWASDGTPDGTRLVADIRPGPDGSVPAGLQAVGGALYFRAQDGAHGSEPWTSDGTAAGTRLVADVFPGSEGVIPGPFYEAGGRVYFVGVAAPGSPWGPEMGLFVLPPR